VFGPTDWGATGDRMYTYYAKNITGGGAAITVTVNLSGGNSSGFFQIFASEFQGIDTVDPLDQVSETTGNGIPVTGSVTRTSADEILCAGCAADSGTVTLSAPFTTDVAAVGNLVGHASVTSIGAQSLAASIDIGNWICHLLSFRHSGAKQPVTGVKFSPDAVLLASFQDVAQASPVAHTRLGLGAADGSFNQGSSAVADLDVSKPTSVQGIDKTDRAFVKVNNNTSTIDAEA